MYLVLFHEAARKAFKWIEECPGYDQYEYIAQRFGFIPHNVFETNVEQFFAIELNKTDISIDDKKAVYALFCKYFKQKMLT